MLRLNVNGKDHDIDVDPNKPLLWAIREDVGLTGTKYGCGIAQCGACTVHVDGVATRSCSMQVGDAAGKKITTIEGLAQDGKLTKVQMLIRLFQINNWAAAIFRAQSSQVDARPMG